MWIYICHVYVDTCKPSAVRYRLSYARSSTSRPWWPCTSDPSTRYVYTVYTDNVPTYLRPLSTQTDYSYTNTSIISIYSYTYLLPLPHIYRAPSSSPRASTYTWTAHTSPPPSGTPSPSPHAWMTATMGPGSTWPQVLHTVWVIIFTRVCTSCYIHYTIHIVHVLNTI